LLGGIFLISAVKIVNIIDYPNSDFFSFWLAGHMVWTVENPYSSAEWIDGHHQFSATWISDPKFLYPLPLAIFLAPLGLLSLYHAYIVWIVLLQFMIVITVVLLLMAKPNPQSKHYIFPILAGIALFRPTIITLFNGQLSGGLLLVSALVIYLWEKDKWWQGSALLPLLALKPNVGIPMIALLSFWLLIRKQARMLGWITISTLALITIGLLRDPNWVIEYLNIGNSKLAQTFGYSPTVWGLAAYISGFKQNTTIIFGSLMAIGMLGGCLILLAQKRRVLRPAMAFSIVITTSLVITPYTWTYDQLLLIIPIIVIMMEMMKGHHPFLLPASLFLLFDILTLFLLLISDKIQMEVLNVIIPLSIYCILFIFTLSMKSQGQLNSSHT
jgi:hypothetical protein